MEISKNVNLKRKRKNSNEIANNTQLKKLKSDSIPKTLKKVSKTQSKKAKDVEIIISKDDVDGNIESRKVQQNEINNDWLECDMLAYVEKIPKSLAENFVNLLNEGCTLPFIARYRKTMIDNLMPDRLQDLYESFQSICLLKKKVKNVIETLKKSNKLTPEIEKSILNAKSLSEVEFVYAPLKSHALTLAERARKLGLESSAIAALNGQHIDPNRLCNLNEEELSTAEKIDTHLTHIVADIIYKDPRVMEEIRKLKEQTRFIIQSSRSKSSKKVEENLEKKKYDSKSDPETYKLYFDWKCPCQFVKPHQTLAVNRGEDEKILSIKVVVPDWFYNQLESFSLSIWKSSYWVKKGLSDAFNRLIKSWLSRQVRSDLTKVAEKEAVKTFTNNLEKYLLTEPIKNRRIVGIDPGFKAGCKIGIIDAEGNKLDACTIYPNLKNNNKMDAAAKQLRNLMSKQNVELIGLGNGTACRETECWLKYHDISEDVPVVIVPEHGASVYSISKEAQKEHPNMDPNLISALSIARRVLDPLGELIKVDPKNLGVGMYQHDIPPKMLESALDCTVEKVVSLVGVDLNTASLALLRRISGLSESRAKNIISHRQEIGGFQCREELLKVRGVGRASYQQCAGFVRVRGIEPLDFTAVHPESYHLAKKFAKKLGLDTKNLLKPEFGEKAEIKCRSIDISTVTKELDTDICTLELIMNAFRQKPVEDNLVTFSKPVYSVSIQQIDQLQEGMSVTGVVRNVVPFGCFVDCGIRENGLIHTSQFGANPTPKLGDRVAVTVIPMAKPGKISLRLDRIID